VSRPLRSKVHYTTTRIISSICQIMHHYERINYTTPRDLPKHLSKEFLCLIKEALSLEAFRENRTPITFFLAKPRIYTISSESINFLSFSLAGYTSKISEGLRIENSNISFELLCIIFTKKKLR
jgi:hypothetical protein